jgi:hypothetical protein
MAMLDFLTLHRLISIKALAALPGEYLCEGRSASKSANP